MPNFVGFSAITTGTPYLETTRTGRDRSRGRDYSHDTASDAEHRELASALRATRATVLLSGYASPLYDELYDGLAPPGPARHAPLGQPRRP